MSPHSRLAFLGRTVRGLVREPRETWAWIWGAYLQLSPVVLAVSPKRRQAVAAVERMRADDRDFREMCRTLARDMLRRELDSPERDATIVLGLLRTILDDGRRPRANHPPNRPN